MSISFGGIASGMDVEGIIAKLMQLERRPVDLMNTKKADFSAKKAYYSNVQSRVSDLLASIEKLTKRAADGSTIFDAKTGTSSDATIATATATKSAANQTISLEVLALPSATKATSTNLVGKFGTGTLISDLGITAGSFTVNSNGTNYNITVNAGDTVGQVLNRINTAVPNAEINTNPNVVNGKVEIYYRNAAVVQLGAGGDTSNFLGKLNLLTGINNTGTETITASQVNTTLNLNVDVATAAANFNTAVTNGSTFSLNGVSFNTAGKTLNQIISDINASAAGVTASFNVGSNKFELTSKTTGSTLINLSDTSGNFLDAVGLIVGGDTAASQTAGANAQFVLNGTTMYATGTSVDETVTGLTGVTLNLNKAVPGTTVNITIGRDSAGVKTAVQEFVTKFNAAISYIDQQTDSKTKAPLAADSRLKAFRNQLRTAVTAAVSGLSGTAYDSLQQAGITTGAVGASSGSAVSTLQFDTTKFDAAYAADPDAIRKLFVGQDLYGALDGTSGDDNLEGTITQIWHLVDDASYTTSSGTTAYGALYNGGATAQGLFPSFQTSLDARIKALNDSIARGEDRLERKEKMLRQQFTAMDRLVQQYQAQGGALNNLISQLDNSNR